MIETLFVLGYIGAGVWGVYIIKECLDGRRYN